MSSYRYGCGKEIEVTIPTRYSAKVAKARCGGTDIWGGVWQCEACAKKIAQPRVPAYGDDDVDYGDEY